MRFLAARDEVSVIRSVRGRTSSQFARSPIASSMMAAHNAAGTTPRADIFSRKKLGPIPDALGK
jgi:hypothetical protein